MLTRTADNPVSSIQLGGDLHKRKGRLFLIILYTVTFIVLALLLIDGWSYYSTPYSERPYHEDYRVFRPAGSRGLIYGIVGASMMILMLLYTFQKRQRIFGRLPLSPFLDFHIYFGVIGPLFIVLHTSFKVQGLVAVSFWSMVAVALSGYFGRYLYQQIPRNMNDQELSLNEINDLYNQFSSELGSHEETYGSLLANTLKSFEEAYTAKSRSVLFLLFKLMLKDLQRPWKKRRLRRRMRNVRGMTRRERDLFVKVAAKRALLKRRLLVLGQVQSLFHYWHVIHKPFAIIMYLIMMVHIGVAVWTGYAWIG